ncbi:MAG: NAD(P)/FAD-dependent oxidoreductase [Ureaplasma sp.]|nr:NAD(P)/FAD-dependent oxidoreductase [Ureaplasma sp.]
MVYDLIIIGAGPVGLHAAFLSGYMKLKTLCIEIDKEIGGQPAKIYPKKEIYDFPGFNSITGEELTNKLFSQISNFSDYVNIQTDTEIIDYKIENDIVNLIDNKNNIYQTKYVLFTNNLGGYFPRKIDFDNFKTNIEISYYLQSIKEYKNKNIVVMGGGDSAVDYAIFIKKHFKAKKVYLLHYRDELTTKTKSVDQIKKANVELLLNYKILEINQNQIIIENNENQQSLTLNNIDNILVQYGVEFKQTKVNTWEGFEKINNKFVVNNFYQTNNNKFFAAGNCTYNPDKINMIIVGISEATIAINKIKALLPDTKKVAW